MLGLSFLYGKKTAVFTDYPFHQNKYADLFKKYILYKKLDYVFCATKSTERFIQFKAFAGDAFVYYENDDAQSLATALKKATKFINSKTYKKRLDILCYDNLPESVGKRLLHLFEGEN